MTLSSRHRIRNPSPGGLRPSTLPLGHGGSPQYWLSHVDGEKTFFVSFKPPRPGTEPRTLAWKAAVLTTTLGPQPKTQAKISNKSVILFWLINMTIWCKHVNRLELQKFFNFCAAYLPVRLDIETKYLIFDMVVKNKKSKFRLWHCNEDEFYRL